MLIIEIGGARALARLHIEDAPIASRRLLEALPLASHLRQSRWSGETTYFQHPSLVDTSLQSTSRAAPRERATSIMCPGTVHYGPARGNIGIAYGQSQSRAIGGQNTWGVHIGTIEEGLAALLAALRAIRRGGATRVTIRSEAG